MEPRSMLPYLSQKHDISDGCHIKQIINQDGAQEMHVHWALNSDDSHMSGKNWQLRTTIRQHEYFSSRQRSPTTKKPDNHIK